MVVFCEPGARLGVGHLNINQVERRTVCVGQMRGALSTADRNGRVCTWRPLSCSAFFDENGCRRTGIQPLPVHTRTVMIGHLPGQVGRAGPAWPRGPVVCTSPHSTGCLKCTERAATTFYAPAVQELRDWFRGKGNFRSSSVSMWHYNIMPALMFKHVQKHVPPFRVAVLPCLPARGVGLLPDGPDCGVSGSPRRSIHGLCPG